MTKASSAADPGSIALARIRRLVLVALDSDDEVEVEAGLDILERIGSALLTGTVVDKLSRVLVGERRWLRQRTAMALSEVATSACVPALLQGLASSDRQVRAYACEGLERAADRRAVVALRKALRDVDDDVRHSAMRALTATKGGLTSAMLRRGLSDRSGHARLAAVWGVAEAFRGDRLSRRDAVRMLDRCVTHERTGVVKVDLLEVMYRDLGVTAALDELRQVAQSRRRAVYERAITAMSVVATCENAEQVVSGLEHIAVRNADARGAVVTALAAVRSRLFGD